MIQEGTHHVPVVQCKSVSFWGWFVKPEVETDVQLNEVTVMCIVLD